MDLRNALEQIFRRSILRIQREPFPYSSSFPIEVLYIAFADEGEKTVIFKKLSRSSMLDGATRVKPHFIHDPMREILVYRSILPALNMASLEFCGAAVNPAIDQYWLFLEKVDGQELYEIGDLEVWQQVAQWLARFHAAGFNEPLPGPARIHIVDHGSGYYTHWAQRAFAAATSQLEAIATGYPRVLDVLTALPSTFIHGEFYPSNVLVDARCTPARVCPVDWEMAAFGPGLLDIAALAAGNWSRSERLVILDAYCSALPEPLRPRDPILAFDCCQLQMALQWIGWSQEWSPPAAHARDWLREALDICANGPLAERLKYASIHG